MSSMIRWRLELIDPLWLWGFAVLPLLAWWASRGLVSFSKRQRAVSLACRAAVVTSLVLAMAGLTLRRPSTAPFVVFAVDRSLSVGDEGMAAEAEFLDHALENRKSNPASFLGFAAAPGPAGPDRKLALAMIEGDEARTGTNLAAAIESAAGAIPPGYSPRVVLLTDGNATSGNARVAAIRAGVPVWTVPLPGRSTDEVQVSEVVVPSQVREGEPFEMKVVVSSNHDDEGFLELFDSNGSIRPAGDSRIKVHKGENTFLITHRLVDQTFARMVAKVRGFRDTRYDDNTARGLVWCVGRPRVLLVEGNLAMANHLADALGQQQIQVDPLRPPEGLPDSLAELQNYDLIILSNVPATHPKLTQNHFQQLRRYVQELGGGLLLIGGRPLVRARRLRPLADRGPAAGLLRLPQGPGEAQPRDGPGARSVELDGRFQARDRQGGRPGGGRAAWPQGSGGDRRLRFPPAMGLHAPPLHREGARDRQT